MVPSHYLNHWWRIINNFVCMSVMWEIGGRIREQLAGQTWGSCWTAGICIKLLISLKSGTQMFYGLWWLFLVGSSILGTKYLPFKKRRLNSIGFNLGMGSASEIRGYTVIPTLIGWAHSHWLSPYPEWVLHWDMFLWVSLMVTQYWSR